MNVDELLTLVAYRLSGHSSVVFRLRKPAYKNYDGWAWRDPSGRLRVDLNPDLTEKELFALACHEIAHLRLHSASFKRVDLDLPEWSISVPSWQRRENFQPQADRESQADRLAARWADLGERNARYFGGGLTGRLRALYENQDFDRSISEAAVKAAAQFSKRGF